MQKFRIRKEEVSSESPRFYIERKGWFFWKTILQYNECYEKRFDSFESALKWLNNYHLKNHFIVTYYNYSTKRIASCDD